MDYAQFLRKNKLLKTSRISIQLWGWDSCNYWGSGRETISFLYTLQSKRCGQQEIRTKPCALKMCA